MKKEEFALSIIIPVYNAEAWIKSTTDHLLAAIRDAGINKYEIICVNDGSTDATKRVCNELVKEHGFVLINQVNSGRFLTRRRGLKIAKYDNILFIDSRTWVDNSSFKFLMQQLSNHPARRVWNAHINVAKKGNVIARFGDAITQIGWRRYFSHPRLVSYGLDDFDYYPKGTTMFFAPKKILEEAFDWFVGATSDLRNSSDDTLLIRHIASTELIWLSPDFSALYHARTTFRAFIKHSYFRGKFFVDGFLHRGTRFFWPLIAFYIVSPIAIILLILAPFLWYVAVLLWLLELLLALFLGVSIKDSLSLFILTPFFAVAYGAGIWTVLLKRIKNRTLGNK